MERAPRQRRSVADLSHDAVVRQPASAGRRALPLRPRCQRAGDRTGRRLLRHRRAPGNVHARHPPPLRTVRGTALDVSSIRDAEWVGARLVAGDTVTEIAAAAGVSRQTAHTWIHRHRLPARTRRRPSDNSLRDLYTTCGSIVSVAAQLDAPTATVHRWLIAAGVELRRPGAPVSARPQ